MFSSTASADSRSPTSAYPTNRALYAMQVGMMPAAALCDVTKRRRVTHMFGAASTEHGSVMLRSSGSRQCYHPKHVHSDVMATETTHKLQYLLVRMTGTCVTHVVHDLLRLRHVPGRGVGAHEQRERVLVGLDACRIEHIVPQEYASSSVWNL